MAIAVEQIGLETAAAGHALPSAGAGEAGAGMSDLYEPTNSKGEPDQIAGTGLPEATGGRIASKSGETEPAPLIYRDEHEALMSQLAQSNQDHSGTEADDFGDVIMEMTRRLMEANRRYGNVDAAMSTHEIGWEVQRERELGERTTSSMKRLIDAGQTREEEPKEHLSENLANEFQKLAETMVGALLAPLTRLLAAETKPEEDAASNYLRSQQDRYQMIFNMAKPK